MNQGIYPGMTDTPVSPIAAGMLVIDSSGIFTVPVADFDVEIVGGAGGATVSFGGPSAGYVKKRFSGAIPGSQAVVIIGSQGAGQGSSASPTAATSGSLSSFLLAGFTPLVAGGGVAPGNTGGTASGGDLNFVGQRGSPAFISTAPDTNGNIGGSNPMGMGGVGPSVNGNGAGSGGSGAASTGGVFAASASGQPGRAIITWEKS